MAHGCMRHHQYWVYIVTNIRRSVFYTGVTNNLLRRLHEHRAGQSIFTARYRTTLLVYAEEHQYILNAIQREKEIKNWRREKRLLFIRQFNPDLNDLWVAIRSGTFEISRCRSK